MNCKFSDFSPLVYFPFFLKKKIRSVREKMAAKLSDLAAGFRLKFHALS
jgi:hypothetical protein